MAVYHVNVRDVPGQKSWILPPYTNRYTGGWDRMNGGIIRKIQDTTSCNNTVKKITRLTNVLPITPTKATTKKK